MRLISALLCFCLTFNVMAASGTVQELERALDEYQYSLTVEWDQKDAAFMTEKTEAFYQTLSVLMEKGLTEQEVMDLVSKKSKDSKAVEALSLKIKMLADKATSSTELAQVITENSKSFYSTGASWEGYYIVGSIGVGLALAALIGYSIWFSANRTCVATAQGTQCGWVSQYPNGPQFYQCWETTYCTEYVEN